jgi:hypothetical protein
LSTGEKRAADKNQEARIVLEIGGFCVLIAGDQCQSILDYRPAVFAREANLRCQHLRSRVVTTNHYHRWLLRQGLAIE